MKKSLLILLSIILLFLSITSCSEDPRVSPTKVFIVSVNGEKREVRFETDIRFVTIGIWETVSLDAVTNRVPTGAKLIWSSLAPDSVSVDENGLCTGISLGSSIIQVAIDGQKETAVCVVNVVADPDHIPDSDGELASIEIVSLVELMKRDVLSIENGVPTIKAKSIEELKRIEFPVSCVLDKKLSSKYPGYTADYIWSVNSDILLDRKGVNEVFSFDAYGMYTIVVQPIIHVPGIETAVPTKSGVIKVSVIPE